MNGDEAIRISNEVAGLAAVLRERARATELFETQVLTGIREVRIDLGVHARDDTARFEGVGARIDEKVSGLYEHLERQANAQRARAWQITGVVIMASLALAGVLISANKSGLL